MKGDENVACGRGWGSKDSVISSSGIVQSVACHQKSFNLSAPENVLSCFKHLFTPLTKLYIQNVISSSII